MQPETIHELYIYNHWANQRSLASVAPLSPEQLPPAAIGRVYQQGGRTIHLPALAADDALVNHSSYHRGQAVTLLRQLGVGVEPLSTDFCCITTWSPKPKPALYQEPSQLRD
jgi:uncharacterized damage-inducible protein DinB